MGFRAQRLEVGEADGYRGIAGLNATLQKCSKGLLILFGDIDLQGRTDGPYPEYAPKQICIKMVLKNLFRRSKIKSMFVAMWERACNKKGNV
jgi:hypothetical protein